MKGFLLFAYGIALLGPQLASASSVQELLSGCRSIATADVSADGVRFAKNFQTGLCWGTFGAIQNVIVHVDEVGRPIYGVCAPPRSTQSQLVAIFVSFAEKNPQRLHEEGFDIALESLQVAFPCKGQKQ